MLESLRQLTSLPNLHPALVHFPVAFAPAALLFDVASLLARRQRWLERCAAALAALAALGAGGAYLAGRAAADSIGVLAPAAEVAMSRHADLALWTLVALVVAAVLRVWSSARLGDEPVAQVTGVRLAGVALLVVGLGLVVVTADRGGALVYRHGVAVATNAGAQGSEPGATHEEAVATEPARSATSAKGASQRMVQLDDGTQEWRPLEGDGPYLDQLIEVDVTDGRGVWSVDPPTGRSGLWLGVDGTAVLLLPKEFDNVVEEARVDVSQLEGTIGLVHHASGTAGGMVFELDSGGSARLVRRPGGEVLDTGEAALPQGPVELVASSIGGHHQKGFVDGRTVVHGHASPGTGMRVGLLVRGSGLLGIERLAARPAPVGD